MGGKTCLFRVTRPLWTVIVTKMGNVLNQKTTLEKVEEFTDRSKV